MLRIVLALLVTLTFHVSYIFFMSSLLIILGLIESPYLALVYSVGLWCLYLAISDYILLYLYKGRTAKLDHDLGLIMNNLAFRYRDTVIQVYFSKTSSTFMRLGLFNGTRLLINENLIKNLTTEEIRAYLDLELSYAKSLGSLVEALLQRFYLVSWYPLSLGIEKLFGKICEKYFLSPIEVVYRGIVLICRKNFNYQGNFASTLPQIAFKTKIIDDCHGKVKLFCFAEKCVNAMLPANIKTDPSELSRFEPDEIFR